MLLPLFEQLLQQVHHLLHLFRCERPVFGPIARDRLYPAPLQRNFFIQLPGTARDAIAIDNKLRRDKAFITLQTAAHKHAGTRNRVVGVNNGGGLVTIVR